MSRSEEIADQPVGALVKRANALREAGRWRDAARCYDAILARIDRGQAHGPRLDALFLKIFCLHEQADAKGVLAAGDASFARLADSDHPRAVEAGSSTLWFKSRALS